MSAVRTTCPYCGVGCGVLATRDPSSGSVSIAGDPEHPSNAGRLCSKGTALGETLSLEGRLLHPEIDGARASWDDALERVASTLSRTIEAHGPDSVALYISGQFLTEDYYVANKLAKGFLGTANIDTNSRLCMASSVVGHKRGLGEDVVPGSYEDLELADTVVLAGSNAAWCHPILFRRIEAARAAREHAPFVVAIDPRRTATAEVADLHLPLRGGTDATLWNGLFVWLADHGQVDARYVLDHTRGYAEALHAARQSAPDVRVVARVCDLDPGAVRTFYERWAANERVVSAYSQGIHQSSSGSDKVNAILNVHLATGRIGRPGMGPFSLTGQPNAMGGREVGGLATMLAAHLGFDVAERDLVRRFWRSPRIAEKPGLRAVELIEAIETGRVKALWVMCTNPVVSLPDADRVAAALRKLDLLVVSDCVKETDTTRLAHVLLPALAWGEKDGTVTNSERRISRQRAFLPPPGEARADWWALCAVARRMGFDGFDFQSAAEVFREHAALSAFENEGATRRVFRLDGLSEIDAEAYEALAPVQWPVAPDGSGAERLFADGAFATADRRARFVPITPRDPVHSLDVQYPLALNTGRVRDHWHTQTRTGRSPRLSRHRREPFVEVHPLDASRLGLADESIARVDSRWGACLVRVAVTDRVREGDVFVPMHWTGETSSAGRVGPLVSRAIDPLSGQPESKHTPVAVTAYPAAWHAVLARVRRDGDPPLPELSASLLPEYWARFTGSGLEGWILADATPALGARAIAERFVPEQGGGHVIDLADEGARRFRRARIVDGALAEVCFVERAPSAWPFELLERLASARELAEIDRLALLAGRSPGGGAEGRTVCGCFGVSETTILTAIRERGACTPKLIGACTSAGTGCGSCVPELVALLASSPAKSATG